MERRVLEIIAEIVRLRIPGTLNFWKICIFEKGIKTFFGKFDFFVCLADGVKTAVDNLSLDVYAGEIFGLLG